MQRQGISPEMYSPNRTTQEDLHKQYEAEAESRTKTNSGLAVAKAEGFEEEINAKSNNWQQITCQLNKFVTFFTRNKRNMTSQ